MSEKTLNFLIKAFLLIAVGSLLVMSGETMVNSPVMKYVKYIFMIAFGLTPVLLIIKIISRIFLSGFKGRPISFIENMFTLYCFVLTKEARKEWADYIEDQKQKSI